MAILSLETTNFRNLTSSVTEFGLGVNLFYGANGSGKTNLLEAIFVVCLGRSQRGAADLVLLNNEAEYYRLSGAIESGGRRIELAVAYQKGGRKRMTLDGNAVRAAELYEHSSVVAAGPEDSQVLSGPPSGRRLFVDLYLSQLSRTYLADLSDYQRALVQKNAALRNEVDPSPFDPLLVQYGSRIMLERVEFLSALAVRAVAAYAAITGGEELLVEYQPKVPFESGKADAAEVAAAFRVALNRMQQRERAAQTSLVGPHRDEVGFTIGGLPARTHGSQGQWRATAVALKLAVYELIREKRGEAPVLLLDEIFAELDNERAERLMERFGSVGQIFLTTAGEPPDSLLREARRFRLVRGQVSEE